VSKTGIVVFGTLLAVTLYDLAVIVVGGVPSSVSQFVTDTTAASPLQSFCCGALCAHFFGWMMFPRDTK